MHFPYILLYNCTQLSFQCFTDGQTETEVQSSLGPQQSCWPWAASSLGHAAFLTTLRLTGFSVASSATRPVTQTQIMVISYMKSPGFSSSVCKAGCNLRESVSLLTAEHLLCGLLLPSLAGEDVLPLSLISSLWKSLSQTKLASLPDLNIICTWGRGKKNYFLLIHTTYMKHLAFQSWLKTGIFFSVLSLWSCSLTRMMLAL